MKFYSQLNTSFGMHKKNDVIADVINSCLNRKIYHRKGNEDEMKYFYYRWVVNKYFYNAEDLKK